MLSSPPLPGDCTHRVDGARRVLLCAAAVMAACGDEGASSGSWRLIAPGGQLVIETELNPTDTADAADAETALRFRVSHAGREVVGWSDLGLRTSRGELVRALRLVSAKRRTVAETYSAAAGKRRHRAVQGRELSLTLATDAAPEISWVVIFRAHDDGVAYRYRLEGSGDVEVLSEASTFNLPRGGRAFLAPYDVLDGMFGGVYEQAFLPTEVGAAPDFSSSWAYPALFHASPDAPWLLVSESDLDETYCGSRLTNSPGDPIYRVTLPQAHEGNGVGRATPRGAMPMTTPWRVMIIGTLATVVQSTLVDDLSRPSEWQDTDWVTPGRSAWSWFSQGTGDVNLQRRYVSFASDMGWEYVLIDEGWDRWQDVDATLPALVAEAAAAEVRINLWYNSGGDHTRNRGTPLDRMLDPATRAAEMDMLSDWGVAGIKVDFFESDKQDRIAQYLGILRDAGERRLVVNFHGATVPRGWQRAYPHLLTQEAVRGGEYYHTGPVVPPDADLNVLYAFTRNVVGPMDYTPVIFEEPFADKGISYAHSLATAVVFESGLQHFADRADGSDTMGYGAVFAAHGFVRDLMAQVPTAWDDTLLLSGDPPGHAVLARRRGATWYIAGITGTTTSELALTIPLTFLDDGTHRLVLIQQGEDPQQLQQLSREVTAADSLTVKLVARDGFLGTLTPL